MKSRYLPGVIPLYLVLLYAWPMARLGFSFFLGRADQWGYFGPMAFYLDHALHQGDWPEWNPLLFCGTPFAANPQAALFYPPHLLRALLDFDPTPSSAIVSLFLMQFAHLCAAGVGMFRLVRAHLSQGEAPHAAATDFASNFGALLYLGSAAVCFRIIQHWQFTAIACWLPWLLLALRRLCTARGACFVQYTLLAGALYGLVLLTGFPQLTLYVSVCAAVYALLCAGTISSAPGLPSRQVVPRAVAGLTVMVILGALLAAVLLVPAAELAAHSARAKEVGESTTLLNPKALHPLDVPGAFLKALVFFPGSNGIRLVGTAAVLLALWGAMTTRRRETLLWLSQLVVALDLCIGPPMPFATLVSAIAPFNLAGPERASLFAVLPLAMLAAHGAHDLFTRPSPTAALSFRHLLFLPLAAGVLSATLEWTVLSPEYVTPRAVWLCALLAGSVIAFQPLLRRKNVAGVLIVVAVLAEQGIWNASFLEFLVRQDSYRGNAGDLDVSAVWRPTNERQLGPDWLENAGMYTLQPVMNGYDPLVIEQARAFISPPALEDLYNRRIAADDMIAGNRRAYSLLKRRFWLLPALGPVPEFKSRAFSPAGGDLAAVSLPLAQDGITAQPEGAEVQSLHLPYFEQTGCHTLLRISWESTAPGRAEVHAHDPAGSGESRCIGELVWDAPGRHEDVLALPDLGRTGISIFPAFYPAGANFRIRSAEIMEDVRDLTGHVRIISSSPNEVSVEVADLAEPGYLAFIESAYPGWRATVDGAAAEIAAFGVFQAVKLPPGAHTVRFEFHSASARIGMILSLTTLFAAISAGLLAAFMQKRKAAA